MAKVSFFLTNNKSKSKTNLFCFISYGLSTINEKGKKTYTPLKYTTKISVPNADVWDVKKNRVKATGGFLEEHELNSLSYNDARNLIAERVNDINNEISDFERTVNSKVLELSKSGALPQRDVLKAELDKVYFPEKVIESYSNSTEIKNMNFLQYIEYFIKTTNNKESTVRSYKVVRDNVYNYQKKHNRVLTFQNADIDFYNSFIKYLQSLSLSKNTIGTRIKIIKTFLNMAFEQGADVNRDYQKRSFRKPSEPTFSIYLTTDEIDLMYNVKLPKRLEVARDIFIIGCDTGLRYGDLVSITDKDITTDNTISKWTEKTKTTVEIPITPRAKKLLEKYDYNFYKIITNTNLNLDIKEVARLAGINERVSHTYTDPKSDKLVTLTAIKWAKVTAHVSRRSFATNAYLAGVPTLAIMAITGHKTESAFMRYIKVTNKENARKLQLHPFFTQMTVVK